jgi:hypothetical protein
MCNDLAGQDGVINHANCGRTGVVYHAQGPSVPGGYKRPDWVAGWMREARESAQVRQMRAGGGGVGGSARWWRLLPLDARALLLARVHADDPAKHLHADWDAVPDAVRCALSVEARAMARVLASCPWR